MSVSVGVSLSSRVSKLHNNEKEHAQPFGSPKPELASQASQEPTRPDEPKETQGTKLNSFGACLLQGFGLRLASCLSIFSEIHKRQTSSFASRGSYIEYLGIAYHES